jgi:pimeloyl-ACP methyl ester carboxylesterase
MKNANFESSRRTFLSSVGAGLIAAKTVSGAQKETKPSAQTRQYWTKEYWAEKGNVKLYMFRKRREAPKQGEQSLPVLFLVHGSSLSARPSFDLDVPGQDYSMMSAFARYGFDVWTMDFESYGRSTRTEGNSDIAEGVKDLKVATDLVMKETGQTKMHMFGESSGGLRAGAFAMAHPERVGRLVLAAFTYTGQGSPTLNDRAKQLEFYRTHSRRPRDREMIRSIFTRDKVGTADPAVAEVLADAEMPFGDSVPTGTYLDMTQSLPLVDPHKVHSPVLLVRGEYDGIATEEDLISFFTKLPNGDRELAIIPGMAHSVVLSYNREQSWQIVRSFLERPGRHDRVGT